MERIKIYTDGACRGNPGRGGWGVFIINGQESKKRERMYLKNFIIAGYL